MNLVDPTYELIDPCPDVHALFLDYNDQFFQGVLVACEVKWSPRMTSCAGVCSYEGRSGLCSIRLSQPLLKLRPRKDLVETLLHEMIHAFLFLTQRNQDRDGHGPDFQYHMNRINKIAGTRISIYHSFHDEVKLYKVHHWRCQGPCKDRQPFRGWVKRASNRAPGPNDLWWAEHLLTCGVSEPPNYKSKKKAVTDKKGTKLGTLDKWISPENKKEPGKTKKPVPKKKVVSPQTNTLDRWIVSPTKSTRNAGNNQTFNGQGIILGGSNNGRSRLLDLYGSKTKGTKMPSTSSNIADEIIVLDVDDVYWQSVDEHPTMDEWESSPKTKDSKSKFRMPIDITPLFKARAKTLAQKKSKDESNTVTLKNQVDEPSLAYRSIAKAANKTAREIHDFGHVILAKRKEYLDFNSTIPTMSNHDRDIFDRDGERGLRSLSEMILQLLNKITAEKIFSEQEKEHLKAVCAILDKDVKKIGRVVTEMRRLRLTSMAHRREINRLSFMVAAKEKRKKSLVASEANSANVSPKISEMRKRFPRKNSNREEEKSLTDNKRKENLTALMDNNAEDPDLDLSPEKIAQLQKENEKLFKKYTTSQDTVNNLETQIFEIQRLQETFSDKVFDQEKEIELLNEEAINTTENIRDGNEWIRQAISNSAGRRVVLLFCIVVLTFTLLFLDWYND